MSTLTTASHLTAQREQLAIQLCEICEEVKRYTVGVTPKARKELQSVSSLHLLPYTSCPSKELLTSPNSLDLFCRDNTPISPSFKLAPRIKATYDLDQECFGQIETVLNHLNELELKNINDVLSNIKGVFQGDLKRDVYLQHPNECAHPLFRPHKADEDSMAVYKSQPTLAKTDQSTHPKKCCSYLRAAQPRIEYYALKIYYCAAYIHQRTPLKNTLESLAWVVTLHENGHLVSHLGLDDERHHWFSFHLTSKENDEMGYEGDLERKENVEGFAQELTKCALERGRLYEMMSSRQRTYYQDALDCFESLLSTQSGPYRQHDVWRKIYPEANDRKLFLLRLRQGIRLHFSKAPEDHLVDYTEKSSKKPLRP